MNLLRCCRGSIDNKSTLMDWEAIEKLLRQIPESLMDQNCDNFCREKHKEGLDRWESIEDLSRSYWAWRKWVFQREEKHIEMIATIKLLKHRSNQHVKLSKTSLNKKMKNIHDPKHTHTHTHTKSLTNFIVQKQVITV